MNTGEDIWYQGGHISPDIDTLIYLFAGILDTDTWWGIKGDTYVTHEQLRSLGADPYLTVGDRDRAVQLLRGEMLRGRLTLSDATTDISMRLSVRASIIPMTDAPYTTMIRTATGLIHFQEYWVRYRGLIPILEVVRHPRYPPMATPAAIEAISTSELVIIGPSNPVTSILPILECFGIVEALKEKTVVAISPFIGDKPVSGPARDLMIARGSEPTSAGVFAEYAGIVDLFVQDIRDPVEVPEAIRCDTLMTSPEIAAGIIRNVLERTQKSHLIKDTRK